MLKPFYDFVRNARDYGIGYVAGRYYSIYPGKIDKADDLKDPQSQNRVKVVVQAVTQRQEALGQYAYPISPYAGKDKGFVFPPDEGDAVWVTFDEGRPDLPRYIGSWWCNDDAENSPKSSDKSFLPKEFRPKTKDDPPTARGFKTKLGHGFLMEDNADDEQGPRVEMWTGEQEEEGEEATKHHTLEFNDKDLFVQMSSYGKEGDSEDERWQHQIRMDDKDGFVRFKSAGTAADEFHSVEMHDEDEFVRVQTNKGQHLLLNDKDQIVQVKTEGNYQTSWDEKNKKISTTTPDREFTLDDNGKSILIRGPKQTLGMGDSSGTNLEDTSGQAISVTSNGDIVLDAKTNCDLTAGANSTVDVTGSMEIKAASLKETIQGALEATAASIKATAQSTIEFTGLTFKFSGTTFQIQVGAPGGIQLGNGGQQLVNLAGATKFSSHTHLVVGAFPGVTNPPLVPMIPGVDTTLTTVAA